MIDKKYLKELAAKLFFDLDDKQTEKLVEELKEIDGMIAQAKATVDEKITPNNYPRVVNCSGLRKDVPVQEKDKDYLSNAKKADKYVVGR